MSGAGAGDAPPASATVGRSSNTSVAASPGNVNVVPAGPVAFRSTVKASPTETSALLAVAVTETGPGIRRAGRRDGRRGGRREQEREQEH